jgi:hypothetical protein
MNPFLAVPRSELQKHPEAATQILALSDKVKELQDVILYTSPMIKMTHLICFLKDAGVRFSFFYDEEELKTIFINSPAKRTD